MYVYLVTQYFIYFKSGTNLILTIIVIQLIINNVAILKKNAYKSLITRKKDNELLSKITAAIS